jgi:hypothetical protein
MDIAGTSCNVKVVAGGLTPVAMNGSSDDALKIHAQGVNYIEPVAPTIATYPTHFLLSRNRENAPPAGDLYLLSGALLI